MKPDIFLGVRALATAVARGIYPLSDIGFDISSFSLPVVLSHRRLEEYERLRPDPLGYPGGLAASDWAALLSYLSRWRDQKLLLEGVRLKIAAHLRPDVVVYGALIGLQTAKDAARGMWVDKNYPGLLAPLRVRVSFTSTVRDCIRRGDRLPVVVPDRPGLELFLFCCWREHAYPEANPRVEEGGLYAPAEIGRLEEVPSADDVAGDYLVRRSSLSPDLCRQFDQWRRDLLPHEGAGMVAWRVDPRQILPLLEDRTLLWEDEKWVSLGEKRKEETI